MEVFGTRASSAGNAKLVQLEQKVSAAEERRQAVLKKQLDRVTTHNKKVMEQRLARQSPEKKQSQLAAKLFTADERRCQIMQKTLDRVADHNRKAMEKRRTLSTEMHEGRKSLCLQIENKMKSAQQKRDELLK